MKNKIYVNVTEFNRGILKFPKCNIEVPVYIGRNGVTKAKREGDGKTPADDEGDSQGGN